MDKLTAIIEALEEQKAEIPRGTVFAEGYRAGIGYAIKALKVANGKELEDVINE